MLAQLRRDVWSAARMEIHEGDLSLDDGRSPAGDFATRWSSRPDEGVVRRATDKAAARAWPATGTAVTLKSPSTTRIAPVTPINPKTRLLTISTSN